MDKPQQSADSVLNGILNKAKRQAVEEDRARTPVVGFKVESWTGHMIVIGEASSDVLGSVLGKQTPRT